MIPGEYHVASEPIDYNGGYEAISLEVKNVGDRAAQVGSHYHFYEANEAGLQFDREKARGKRLDIPAGTAIRFEPGETKTVQLIDFGGKRRIFGFNNKVNGFLDQKEDKSMSFKMDREEYAQHYGPTVGDSVRLGDTNLFAAI